MTQNSINRLVLKCYRQIRPNGELCDQQASVTSALRHKVKSDTPFLHILTFICIHAERFRYLKERQLFTLCIHVATKCILLYTLTHFPMFQRASSIVLTAACISLGLTLRQCIWATLYICIAYGSQNEIGETISENIIRNLSWQLKKQILVVGNGIFKHWLN